jgi:hypothetical protein
MLTLNRISLDALEQIRQKMAVGKRPLSIRLLMELTNRSADQEDITRSGI